MSARATAGEKTSGRVHPRRRARELALQGLYQWQLSRNAPETIREGLAESPGYARADAEFFDAMWRGTVDEWNELIAACEPYLDRSAASLSPIERAVLVLGAWELKHRPDVPYRAAIGEAIELAKSYGGTDGYKFVNGVLDRVAAQMRPGEVEARGDAR